MKFIHIIIFKTLVCETWSAKPRWFFVMIKIIMILCCDKNGLKGTITETFFLISHINQCNLEEDGIGLGTKQESVVLKL